MDEKGEEEQHQVCDSKAIKKVQQYFVFTPLRMLKMQRKLRRLQRQKQRKRKAESEIQRKTKKQIVEGPTNDAMETNGEPTSIQELLTFQELITTFDMEGTIPVTVGFSFKFFTIIARTFHRERSLHSKTSSIVLLAKEKTESTSTDHASTARAASATTNKETSLKNCFRVNQS